MSESKVLTFLYDGIEESELVIAVNTLRRVGISVTIAGLLNDQFVTGRTNLKIIPDVDLKHVSNDLFDCILLPGGPGVEKLTKIEKVGNILKHHYKNDKLIAAICGGPKVLLDFQIGFGKKITAYPKLKQNFTKDYVFTDERVCIDGNLITSQAPGTAFEFSLALIKYLKGEHRKNEIINKLLIKS